MKKCAFLFAVILSLVGSAQGATMRMEGEVKATSIKVTPAPTPTALATAAAGVSGMDVTSGDAPDCTFSDTDPATKNDKGGTGGGISIKTGKGAAVTGSGLADDGGEGGLLTLEAAPGGASSNGKGGSGGLIWLKAGNGGAGAGGDLAKQGNGGAIFLTPGTGLIPGFVVIRGSYISQSDNNDYPPVVQNKAYNGHSNPTTPPYLPETVQCGVFEMDRLRGDFGGPLLICNGDWMGQVRFAGCGQTTGPNAPHLVPGADIIGVVESGTISLNSMPGRLELRSTSENTSNPVTRLKVRQDGIVEICNGPVNADPQIDNEMHFLDSSSGAYLSAGGHWQEPSSRSRKRNISVVDKKAAWDALDAMAPVDYEYKKQELCVEMNDGRILPFAQAEEEIRGRVIHSRRMTLDDVSKRTFTRLTEAGSGEWHRGFIAEDLPDKMVSADRKTISISDIAANNTAALKEAKSPDREDRGGPGEGEEGGRGNHGVAHGGQPALDRPLGGCGGTGRGELGGLGNQRVGLYAFADNCLGDRQVAVGRGGLRRRLGVGWMR